ncbi:MAG: peptide MFS transporter [Myxococcales bacterium]|nr:peptide MFS transporter [Myxococcota bacterium]MDW8280252.1 peptide MFS transporter [Myxococcales bacterium]
MPSRHPSGLYVLFFTEMWERFGYYLMLAIFTLYLNEHLKMSEGEAASLYGTYIGLVYLSPLFGGMLADRLIGYRRSVILGAVLLALGYFLLAVDRMATFYLSLGILILGNGLFKPNISTLVGNLYPQGDMRRDSAFSIFYMGINIGALFAPLAAGYMRSRYGWSVAFATAGVGMSFGLLTFALLHRLLAVADQRSSLSAVLQTPLPPEYEDRPDPPEVERERIRALVVMCAIVMLFWVAFHQNGSTLTFWARDHTDRTLGGLLSHEINPEYFAAINPIFVILLTPVVVSTFSALRRRGLEPSTPAKIGIGMLLTAASFVIMVVASLVGGNTGKVHAMWIVSSYFVVTLAELCLSPMGLSMVTKLAPRRMTAMMMGVWFLATAIGNKLSGEIGIFWKLWPHHWFFGMLVASSLAAAALLTVQLRRLAAAMPKEGHP